MFSHGIAGKRLCIVNNLGHIYHTLDLYPTQNMHLKTKSTMRDTLVIWISKKVRDWYL